ncbi:MAG: M14 family metallopeptidase [Planctomycetota bacterium]
MNSSRMTGRRMKCVAGLKPANRGRDALGTCRPRIYTYFSAVAALSMCLVLSSCAASAQASAETGGFVEPANFDPTVPSPESITGHAVAEKAVRYDALERYARGLADASGLVTFTSYGKSHEGRTLYYLTITSEANHRRLDQIRADNAKLSDPRKLGGAAQADRLVDSLPAVAWLNYSIHGDELSSTEAALYVMYHLVADRSAANRRLLDEVVIHLNPLVNPDGRERYLSYLEQLTGVVSSPDYQAMQHQSLWSRGRGNHYLFDLNRDWLVHLQPEVRDLAGQILSWNPHLVVDSHEQSGLDTYLFDPPREPINVNLSAKVLEWRDRFSKDQAEAFNRYGWSYYTKDWYSEWSPVYTNAWAGMQGSIGLLYEQARVNAASVKQATGEEISYSQAVHHHIVSTLTNLETLRANRRQILRDFVADRRWAVEEEVTGRTFLLQPCADTSRWNRFVELLRSQGIEVEFAQEAFEAEDVSDIRAKKTASKKFPKGTLVVRSGQPRRRMLQTLCNFDPRLTDGFLVKERKELENRRDTLLYDVTAWNLPMAFGLDAYWAASVSDVRTGTEPPGAAADLPKLSRKGGYGYLIDFADSRAYSVIVRLFENECHPRIAVKPLKMEGHEYQPGTVLLRAHENPDDLRDVLQKIESDFEVGVHAVDGALVEDGPDLGSRKFELLTAPKVAMASQWPVYSTSFGSVWYLLDHQLRLQSSPINIQGIGGVDLRKYNVLILPDSGDLGPVLDKRAVEKLKKWVESGGTLIALGSSAAYVAGKDRGLSSVRLRRDVLDKLAEYDEAVEREESARRIDIDPAKIWGTGTSETKKAEPEDEKDEPKKPDVEKLKRSDEWQRIFSPTGTFLAGVVNSEHWLGYGLGERLPVMFRGSRAFMSKHPVQTAVRLAGADELRLSGLLWPEARGRIAQTAYATAESVGRGQIILFATDPTYRMWLPGAQRLFLNAVLLGPGMGTSQPLPW